MLALVAKTARYLRREYPKTAGMCLAYGGLAALACVAAPLWGEFLIITLPLAWNMISNFSGEMRSSKNRSWINGVRIEGDARDVRSARMMQKLVTSYTKKFQHTTKLPPAVRRKIAAHFADIGPRLQRLHMSDANGNPVASLPFTRKVYDLSGKPVRQPVASFASVPDIKAPAPAAPASMNRTPPGNALKSAMQDAASADVPLQTAPGFRPKNQPQGPKV